MYVTKREAVAFANQSRNHQEKSPLLFLTAGKVQMLAPKALVKTLGIRYILWVYTQLPMVLYQCTLGGNTAFSPTILAIRLFVVCGKMSGWIAMQSG